MVKHDIIDAAKSVAEADLAYPKPADMLGLWKRVAGARSMRIVAGTRTDFAVRLRGPLPGVAPADEGAMTWHD